MFQKNHIGFNHVHFRQASIPFTFCFKFSKGDPTAKKKGPNPQQKNYFRAVNETSMDTSAGPLSYLNCISSTTVSGVNYDTTIIEFTARGQTAQQQEDPVQCDTFNRHQLAAGE